MKNPLLIFLYILTELSVPAGANAVKDWGFGETLAQSDIVIVGTLDSTVNQPSQLGETPGLVHIQIQYVIKGKPPTSIVLDRGLGNAEMQISCCEKNLRYLLFLVRGPTGMYASVNGRYGIYKLQD